MEKDTLVLPSLSPVGDKPISVMIDDRYTSADGGVLMFQDVERRLNLANRLAACLHDPRQPGKIKAEPDGVDTRYIVTNLTDRRAQGLYERKYCQRGRMENLLKSSTWLPTVPPA